MSPLHDLSSEDVRKFTNVLGHCKCCSGFLVMMKLLVIMLMCLLGYVGTEQNIGCVKMAVMEGNFTCADRMQSIFIFGAYIVHQHGCHNSLRHIEKVLEAEITHYMQITCNARTECHFHKSLLHSYISQDQEYPYVIDYSCEWLGLYPVTPILWGWRDIVYSASGNMFILQSKNYPDDNAPAVDTDCDISFQPQSGEFIIVSLKDLHINGAINGGSESDINKYCIKPTNSSCMSPGNTVSLLSSGSISLQQSSAVMHARYYILIYVSKSGPINEKPLNRTFSLKCRNAVLKEPDALTPAPIPALTPAPSVPLSAIVPATTTSDPSGSERSTISTDSATTKKAIAASTLPAAVGGTLTGVLLIALCVMFFFLWRRKQRNRKEMDSEKSTRDNGKSLQNQPPEYVNVVSPKQGSNDVSYEPLDSDLIKHNGVNGSAPVHPKDISPSKPTSVNHMEVNGDVYALPGTVSPKKSQIKPPIATKPHLASQRSIPAAAAPEDDVDDVEICDNIIYHNI